MPRYYLDDVEVDRATALGAWLASSTFRLAKFADSIWPKAEAGNPNGAVVNHLREAGIRIDREDLRPNTGLPAASDLTTQPNQAQTAEKP